MKMTVDLAQALGQVYNALLTVQTAGTNTMTMSACLQILSQVLNGSQIENADEAVLADKEGHPDETTD